MRLLATIGVLLLLAFPAPTQGEFAPLDRWRAPASRFSYQPHPSVARVIVPEPDGTSFGSGTLVDIRDEYGLVLTNWHVVAGASGPIEVKFPDGFRSQARALKVDSNWDLAALVIWKPNCDPVALASRAPQPGDVLTICGYGSGDFRAATGRCTQYYSPQIDLPRELVELDVEARQGDSGGPILNDQGELAGVLFGAGRGTTLGSFEGRVKMFLASLAPDIGTAGATTLVASAAPPAEPPSTSPPPVPRETDLANLPLGRQPVSSHQCESCTNCPGGVCPPRVTPRWTSAPPPESPPVAASSWPELKPPTPPEMGAVDAAPTIAAVPEAPPAVPLSGDWFDQAKNVLAIIGVGALLLHGLKLAG